MSLSNNSNHLLKLSITEALKGLKERKFSAKELVSAHLDRMQDRRHLNAYITETAQVALIQAEQADARYKSNEAYPLDGIPIAHKDMFCTKGILTTAGSKMLSNFIPPYESTVTHLLNEAGCISLGKTNCDEFAMGSSNETSYFGPVINPWKRQEDFQDLVPGGSSGGSAAAVAAGMAMGATGTDTGGSIRQPAAFCGLVGIKPTYGRCSRWGIIAFASSLDQAGIFARSVSDAALLLQHCAGFDPKDSTSIEANVPHYFKGLGKPIKGLKIGIPKEYQHPSLREDVKAYWTKAASWLREQGAEIIDISLPTTSYALATYYIIAPAEASSNLARYDGVRFGRRAEGKTIEELYENTRGEDFGDEVKRRIFIGTYVLSAGYYDAYYIKAQKVRAQIVRDFQKAFSLVDVILTPTTPSPAFGLGDKCADPLEMYMNDILTVPASLAGLPAISVPIGHSKEGLPLGIQFIGPYLGEETILNAAHWAETMASFQHNL